MDPLTTPLFSSYAAATLLLSLNLYFLWNYSGLVRMRHKVTTNPEDAALLADGTEVRQSLPVEVERVLRAHQNAHFNIIPFLFLSLLYVNMHPGIGLAKSLLGLFVVGRYLHSITYLKGLQPWRTIGYLLSLICTVVMMADMVRMLVGM